MIPSFPGLEDFEGTWLHSRDYKDADKWAGKKVVVVGTANTGTCSSCFVADGES
jgi:cation diffusion facilitator CzcD-associated flavoprotein CzcO